MPPARGQPTLLLAGGIDFGEGTRTAPKGRTSRLPPLPRFAALPGTESEVNDLQARFQKAFRGAPAPTVLSEGGATKAAFLKEAPKARYLHLATHGFFAPEAEPSALAAGQRAGLLRGTSWDQKLAGRHPGLLSGVVFAGANDPRRPPEEALLTALEAAELELGAAELVTLSACDTGRGQVAGGEGVLGLQRAFQLAGARSVVASLWRVPDEPTHQLMRELYRRTWSARPLGRAEALRQAQLWMLEHYKPRSGLELAEKTRSGLEPAGKKGGPPSPYYWAAFVLSGDWR
jgi:CHAT domain-containing protein